MENLDLFKILEAVFPILAVIFGVYFASAKAKLNSVASLIVNVNKSLEDNVLTQEEMKIIVADVMRILGKDVPKEVPK